MMENSCSLDEDLLIFFKLLERGGEKTLISNYNKGLTDQIEKNIEDEKGFKEEMVDENHLFFNIIFLKDYFKGFFIHHIKKSNRYLELKEEEKKYACFFQAIDDNVIHAFYKSIFSSYNIKSIKKESAKEEFEKLLMGNMDFDKIPIVISKINNALLDLRSNILYLYLINIHPQIIIEIPEEAIEGDSLGIIGPKDDEIILSGIKRISYMGFSMLLVLNAFINVAHKKNSLNSDQEISSVIKNPEKEKNTDFNRKKIRARNRCRLL